MEQDGSQWRLAPGLLPPTDSLRDLREVGVGDRQMAFETWCELDEFGFYSVLVKTVRLSLMVRSWLNVPVLRTRPSIALR